MNWYIFKAFTAEDCAIEVCRWIDENKNPVLTITQIVDKSGYIYTTIFYIEKEN